jgi:hypothetical protein
MKTLSGPTDWLSGSGGTGETPSQLCTTSSRACTLSGASRCPLEPVLAARPLIEMVSHLNVSGTHSPQLATESGLGLRLLVPYLCFIALQRPCNALNSAVSRFSFDRLIATSTIVAYAAPLRAKSSNSE